MSIRRSALAALFAIPLVLAACGNDDQAPAPTTSSAASTTTSTTSATTSSTTSSTSSETPAPEPVVDEPAAVEPVPEQQGIWAPPGQGTRCPGTDAYVWNYADCNPSNGVIDPDEFYRLTEPTPVYEEPYRSGGCVGPLKRAATTTTTATRSGSTRRPARPHPGTTTTTATPPWNPLARK